MGGPIDIEHRGWEYVIHDHDRDHLVTKARCKVLPDSERSDFRCRRAVDSSSFLMKTIYLTTFRRQLINELSYFIIQSRCPINQLCRCNVASISKMSNRNLLQNNIMYFFIWRLKINLQLTFN